MAHKLLDLKIHPGSLNLLAPADQLPAGDCTDLTGFWPGAAGRLEQTPGYIGLTAGYGIKPFDSLCQTAGRLYFGGGGTLYRRSGGTDTPIGTDYDTYPLAMLAFQGYVWIMNRARQRKDNGTTTSNWTPAPPAVPVLTDSALSAIVLTVVTSQPGVPVGADGDFTRVLVWVSSALGNLQVGDLVSLTGSSEPALNVSGPITDVFPGTPNSLFYVQAQTPAATGFGTGGEANYTSVGMPQGQHSYWITWQYADLGESNPSGFPGSVTGTPVTVAAAGHYVNVDASSAIAAVPPGVVGWNIYRQSPDMPSAYRLNENVLGLERTFVYDYGDEVHRHDSAYLIDGLGIIMEGDHDPAPAARIMANQAYNGRLVVANSAEFPNRIWFTQPLQPSFFRGSGNPQSGDWVDVGTDRADEVLAMSVKPGQIIVYRAKSIWRVIGDFEDPSGRVEVAVPDLGVVGPRAVASSSLGDYFRSQEGVYKYNGDWAQKLSQKLDPVFRNIPAENFGPELAAYRQNCALGLHAGRLWVSNTVGGTFNTESYILHIETGRWFARKTGYGAYLDAGTALLGAGVGDVFQLETGYREGNTSYTIMAYQSAYEDCGVPDHEKSWADLVVNHNTRGVWLDVECRTNKNATANDAFQLDTGITSTELTKQVIPLVYPGTYPVVELRGKPIRSFNLSTRIHGTGTTDVPGSAIETPIILHYYLEARAGMLYDTDEMDHGLPGVVKTVDMVEFDMDSSKGEGSLQIYSDVPGASMAPRLGSGVVIKQTIGRGTVRIVLPTPVEGKLLRYVATTTSGFQVYGFRARITPIGVHVDGTVGEVWDTRAIPLL